MNRSKHNSHKAQRGGPCKQVVFQPGGPTTEPDGFIRCAIPSTRSIFTGALCQNWREEQHTQYECQRDVFPLCFTVSSHRQSRLSITPGFHLPIRISSAHRQGGRKPLALPEDWPLTQSQAGQSRHRTDNSGSAWRRCSVMFPPPGWSLPIRRHLRVVESHRWQKRWIREDR